MRREIPRTLASLLWLHDLGDPNQRRSSVESLETMLWRYSNGHSALVHDARISLTDDLIKDHWDVIFLGPTFLCNRYSQKRLADIELRFGWIAGSNAVKVALPQDDYDCSEILDDWMVRWGINVCYSVLPSFSSVLYPVFSRFGEIRSAYTGYVDDSCVNKSKTATSHEDRPRDVFYRATRLPANFGSLGRLKAEIADGFLKLAPQIRPGLSLDISCSAKDVLWGDTWHKHLSQAKFTLATPSGSSLLDPRGAYRHCVKDLSSGLAFREIEDKCFPGQDNKYAFEALSPRHIEAALWGTVQIAVEGNYSEVLEPNVHYIPVSRDLSNLRDVLELMEDPGIVSAIRTNARSRVLDVRGLRLSKFAQDLLSIIPQSSHPLGASSQNQLRRPEGIAHQEASNRASTRYWRRNRQLTLAKRVVGAIGLGKAARQVCDFLRVEK